MFVGVWPIILGDEDEGEIAVGFVIIGEVGEEFSEDLTSLE